uniref:X-ray repair cross-complementing protein 5 n=1 Tax=Lygus hesperus TaxID=30085 RepID=A0A0A9XCG3_LYGHE
MLPEVELRFAQDESRKTLFGATEVLLTYADLEAMKRKTGPPSFTFLGSVKSSKITRSMLVGADVYVMVSDGTKRSQAQLTALINALLRQNKYGLARRVAVRDGKVNIGILYPVSDDLGKALYFLKLPVVDWIKSVPSRAIPDVIEQPLVDMMNDLIDRMSLEGKGRDLLLRDPNFQTRCALVESRARTLTDPGIPDHILALYDPFPELREAGAPIIEKITSAYTIPPPPPDKEEAVVNSKIEKKEAEVKKELTDAEKAEVAEIQKLAACDPDSLLIDGQKLYDERIIPERMDTEDVLKLLE